MLKMFTVAALVLGVAAPLAAVPAAAASAVGGAAIAPDLQPDSGIVQVYGGCGPYGHRGPYGGCRPGGQAGYAYGGYRRACPPGWHLGPYGGRCWRN